MYCVKRLIVVGAILTAMPVGTALAQGTLTNRVPESAAAGQGRLSPRADGTRAGDGRRDGAPRNIHMVIQTESSMSQQELAAKFDSARKSTQGCSFESYDVRPIDPNTYQLLKSILQGVALPNVASQGAVSIEPMEGQDGAWTVNLKSDTKYLESAKLKVANSTQGEQELAMKAEPKDKTSANLRYHSPGVYILKVPAGAEPKSATLMVTDEAKGGKAPPVAVEVAWPDSGRCYLVTLKGVEGEEKELYDTLKDGKKIANPIKGIEDATKAAIVVASFKEMLAVVIVFKDDAIQLTFPKPGGGVEPKRMWMRFPLTKNDEASISKELDEKFAGDGFKTVPAWIRQNLLGERLTPEGSTGWFELPWNAEHQAFERTLPIDTKSWQERLVNNKEFMGENAILLYEFEGEDESREIIKLDNGKRYRPYQVVGWLTGLPSAPTAGAGAGK